MGAKDEKGGADLEKEEGTGELENRRRVGVLEGFTVDGELSCKGWRGRYRFYGERCKRGAGGFPEVFGR